MNVKTTMCNPEHEQFVPVLKMLNRLYPLGRSARRHAAPFLLTLCCSYAMVIIVQSVFFKIARLVACVSCSYISSRMKNMWIISCILIDGMVKLQIDETARQK
jgi:hypothetical protein